MMNYKPTSNKGDKLTTEQVANFLKVGKKEGDVYDDVMYYDDAKIKELVELQDTKRSRHIAFKVVEESSASHSHSHLHHIREK